MIWNKSYISMCQNVQVKVQSLDLGGWPDMCGTAQYFQLKFLIIKIEAMLNFQMWRDNCSVCLRYFFPIAQSVTTAADWQPIALHFYVLKPASLSPMLLYLAHCHCMGNRPLSFTGINQVSGQQDIYTHLSNLKQNSSDYSKSTPPLTGSWTDLNSLDLMSLDLSFSHSFATSVLN